MNCSTSSWCFPRAESLLSRPKTHSGRGRKRLKALVFFHTLTSSAWAWHCTLQNHPWLELSDVHKETTEDIRVTVIPFYMGFRQGYVAILPSLKTNVANSDVSRENQQNNVFWWRYCIRYIVCLWMLSCSTRSDFLLRLENLGEATVQLRERNWRIFSLSGGENADQKVKFKQCCRDIK